MVIIVLVIGAALNLYHLGGLYYHHTRAGGAPINAYGHTDWFVQGQWPGMQYLAAVNRLPRGSRVMLVGEARSFYVLPVCEYATVFNRLPLAEAVRRDPRPDAVLEWLRRRGTTHLLVNWAEMDRLRRTYGFAPQVDAGLFERLTAAGLKPIGSFAIREGLPPYATLYEVPSE